MENLFGEIIHSYLAADAVRDEVFKQASADMAREVGYVCPVTFTAAAWEAYVAWDEDDPRSQDQDGRLWDVLFMSRRAGVRAAESVALGAPERFSFEFYAIPRTPADQVEPLLVSLDVVCQAWDASGRPCLTFLMPGED